MKRIHIRRALRWALPLVIALGITMLVRPVLAQLAGDRVDLVEYLSQHDVVTGSEVREGISSVYYEYNNEKFFVSAPDRNSHSPSSAGKYVAYVGEVSSIGQVFVYDILSEQTIQLTSVSSNLNPKVSWNGWVVWEGWIPEEDGWQVFLYDGLSIRQLTTGELSMNADIDGEQIVYSRRDAQGEWSAFAYSKDQDKSVGITVGSKARTVTLKDGKIILANGEDEFSLTIESLFLLDRFGARARSLETIDEEQVEQELLRVTPDLSVATATPSAGDAQPQSATSAAVTQ